MRRTILKLALLAAAAGILPASVMAADDNHYTRRVVGAVYTMTNATTGNEILVFDRRANGRLRAAGSVSTGGVGTGGGLGNQGAVILRAGERFLFAVNAGSNDISVFAVKRHGLQLIDRTPSNGQRPVSVTAKRGLLYVLNAGSDTIAGFYVSRHGKLTPISDSIRPLSGSGTGPAQIEFSPDGDTLVVTEKATNRIVTYEVSRRGLAGDPQVFPSAGQTPFGFAFGKRSDLVVSEATGGGPNASTVSSYELGDDGQVQVINTISNGQSAVCWVVITPDGRFAFVSNTGSGNLTALRIDESGVLTSLNADGNSADTGPGSAPIDMALNRNGRFLYTLNSGNGTISAFRVRNDGSLLPFTSGIAGLPNGANGLAAR